MVIKWVLVILGFCVAFSDPLNSLQMTGREIMQKQKDLHQSTSELVEQEMKLIDRKGSEEVRSVKIYIKEVKPDENKTLVVFESPADVKGTALLTWQHIDRDDDQWLFLPASGRMKRIAKGGKKNYFMGTDFTYEDMEREKLDDFDYTILKEEQFDSQNCYVLEAIPSNERKRRESGYSKRIAWITKDNYLILKIEYYSRQGKLIKTQTSAEWRVAQGTAWRAGKILMDNHRDRHKTSISITKIELNKNIDDQTFTERFILQGRHIR